MRFCRSHSWFKMTSSWPFANLQATTKLMGNQKNRDNGQQQKTSSSLVFYLEVGGLGNFIKRIQNIIFHGASSESQAFKKPEKSWRSYNNCKRHWPGPAWLISWCPICILWRTMHSRPWSRLHIMEVVHKNRNYNGCHIMLYEILVAMLNIQTQQQDKEDNTD